MRGFLNGFAGSAGPFGQSVHEEIEQQLDALVRVADREVVGHVDEVGEALAWECGDVVACRRRGV